MPRKRDQINPTPCFPLMSYTFDIPDPEALTLSPPDAKLLGDLLQGISLQNISSFITLSFILHTLNSTSHRTNPLCNNIWYPCITLPLSHLPFSIVSQNVRTHHVNNAFLLFIGNNCIGYVPYIHACVCDSVFVWMGLFVFRQGPENSFVCVMF